MIHPERAKLIPVSGSNDQPDLPNAVDVQFNPASLKVSLSNTLKENPRQGNSRASQFVDKSSSTLAVELLFDTTYIDNAAEAIYRDRAQQEGRSRANIEAGSDVRLLTKRIAEAFIKPVEGGSQLGAPNRCLFQWGAFEFLGMVQGFEETLDFFSPEGRPLRATVTLRLSEDRYQFRSREVAQAARETPQLSGTGAGNDDSKPSQQASPVPGGAGGGSEPGWRDTAMFNGIESPRMPSVSALAVPKVSVSAAIGGSVGMGAGASASLGVGISAGAGFGAGAGVSTSAGSATGASNSPPFRFGASASLGTGIAGAFGQNANLSAGIAPRRPQSLTSSTIKLGGKAGVGFD